MQTKVDVVMATPEEASSIEPRTVAAKSSTPDESWSNRELADYAQQHAIDMQGAKRKDAKLARIAEALAQRAGTAPGE